MRKDSFVYPLGKLKKLEILKCDGQTAEGQTDLKSEIVIQIDDRNWSSEEIS